MSDGRFTREELVAAPVGIFRREMAVRLQDVDAAGVVFFVRVLEAAHDALMAYIAESGFSAPEMLEAGVLVTPVKHAEADYLAPLRFGDRVEIELVCARVQATEATVGVRLVRLPERKIAAVAQIRQVCVEVKSGARAPMPAPLAAALRRLEPAGGR
jgi:YbgC/YbaW family acyl-CoA thioester hydrolase